MTKSESIEVSENKYPLQLTRLKKSRTKSTPSLHDMCPIELKKSSQDNTSENSENSEDGYIPHTLEPVAGANFHQQLQQQFQQQISVSQTLRVPERPVARLKRSLSGKLRLSSNKIVDPSSLLHSYSVPESRQTGDTLHKAIQHGASKQQISKLLKKYPVDLIDNEGRTALHISASKGLLQCAKKLIRKGANINTQDSKGFTPLLCAAVSSKLAVCEYLLELKSIEVSIANKQNSSVLHYLVRATVDEDNSLLYRRILEMLIDKGIDINLPNQQGEAPLHLACFRSNTAAAAFLLERGVDCNLTNALGDTSLHYACRCGSIQLVRMLMENGADPTIVSKADDQTPVNAADSYGHVDILDCILSIIEEEIAFSSTSRRVRLNETSSVKIGFLFVLVENDWKHLYVILSKQTIACYVDDNSVNFCQQLQISHDSQVTSEEGTIMADEQLWCFTVTSKSGVSISFASNSPEKREEWISDIEEVIGQRVNLFELYKGLKSKSKPREMQRIRERHSTLLVAESGIKLLLPMPVNEYPKWIIKDVDLAAATMSEIVALEDVVFIKNFVKFLLHHQLLESFLKAALTHDIRKTTMGKTLFRETSLSTVMLTSYLEMKEGREYLKSTILGLLQSVSASDFQHVDLNLTSTPPPTTSDRALFRANFEKLITLAQQFINGVFASVNKCPVIFRELMLHTKELVDKVFPNMTHAIIGSFIFLRFICPAILSPQDKIGQKFWDTPPRVCFLITKVLQAVSNGVEFDGSKEEHMQRFNPFIKQNRLHVHDFFDNLTDAKSVSKCKENKSPRRQLSLSELASVEKIISDHIQSQQERMKTFTVCPLPEDKN